jgi:signal transduction histidine kinase
MIKPHPVSEAAPNEHETRFTPEEAALLMRLRVFVTMRYVAVVGVVVATLVASFVFDISLDLLPIYIICGLIVFYNLVLFIQLRNIHVGEAGSVIRRARQHSNLHIFLDLIALTAILHFTGGIENPFLFFYVFHIVLASIALNYRIVYVTATVALFLVCLLTSLEYAGVIPHVNLAGFVDPTLYRKTSYVIAVLISLMAILYGTTYMATAISGELRKRQRQVVDLQEKLLAEKSVELEKVGKELVKLEEERTRFLRFLGIAAHDLKAPLSAIQGYMWNMLGGFGGSLNDRGKHMLERSSIRITELLNLISDLLDIPRIETGQLVSEMKEISLREVITNCVDGLASTATKKGLAFKVEMPKELPAVCGSVPRLQQVLNNLIGNSIKYTSEGSVTLRVKVTDNEIRVAVLDTGVGIPSEEVTKVFDDFYRASNVEAQGTGLGLSIAKRIVEAHGGKIWCESPCPETNNGSIFTFTIPKLARV